MDMDQDEDEEDEMDGPMASPLPRPCRMRSTGSGSSTVVPSSTISSSSGDDERSSVREARGRPCTGRKPTAFDMDAYSYLLYEEGKGGKKERNVNAFNIRENPHFLSKNF